MDVEQTSSKLSHLGPIISSVFPLDDSFATFTAMRQLDSSLSVHNWPGCCSSWVEMLPKSAVFTNSHSWDVLRGMGFATVRPCLCKCHWNLSKNKTKQNTVGKIVGSHSSRLAQFAFLYAPRPGMALPTVSWAVPQQSSIKKMTHKPAYRLRLLDAT